MDRLPVCISSGFLVHIEEVQGLSWLKFSKNREKYTTLKWLASYIFKGEYTRVISTQIKQNITSTPI